MSKQERRAEEIRETKIRVFSEQGGVCFWCRAPMQMEAFELAHRIPQRKWCLGKWGRPVIHHRLNVVGTHAGSCNSHVQINPDSLQAEKLAREIRRELGKE